MIRGIVIGPDGIKKLNDESDPVNGAASILIAHRTISTLKKLAEEDPAAGKQILKGMMSRLTDELRKYPATKPTIVAALVLTEYFNHEGDWSKGIECMEEACQRVAGIPLARLVSEMGPETDTYLQKMGSGEVYK